MTKADKSAIDHKRRILLQALTSGALAATAMGASAHAHVRDKDGKMRMPQRYPGPKPKVAMLVYPKMVLLDLIGPQTVLNILGCEIHLVWKDRTPCITDTRIAIPPTTTFDECPKDLDILFAPGGTFGTIDCMKDDQVLDFMADRGERAKYVTSVCTGSLILAAAGLLNGYKATTLWALTDILPLLGATYVDERVVVDRNRYTGGGVTAGIDFALTIGAELRGEDEAKRAQLIIEYSPQPPFSAGTPQEAGEELTSAVKSGRTGMDGMVRDAALEAAKRFN